MIRIFGDHDDKTIGQLERCVSAVEGSRGVLCADGHLGYSAPIGGVIAYREHVSPSGAGYDIGCIAAGTPVLSEDGWHVPIEQVRADDPMTCWDGFGLRAIDPNLGAVSRGVKPTLRVTLAGGRSLACTPDHKIRTKLGWREASELRLDDAVAAPPFVGLPFEGATGVLPVEVERRRAAQLEQRRLWPVRIEDPRFPALLRIFAYVCGDGHLTLDGKCVALFTSVAEDAVALRDDLTNLGFEPALDVRERGGNVRTQYVVRVGSTGLHALLASMGCPVGRKAERWAADPFPWLLELPGWMRALFLSSFASAEATTPAIIAGRLANVTIKQAARSRAIVDALVELFESLGFAVGVSLSGPVRDGITTWAVQVVGGEREQLRFLTEVGFCRAIDKRRAAAAAFSFVTQRGDEVARRVEAIETGRLLKSAGAATVREIVDAASAAHEVPRSLIEHGLYGRGASRVPKGWTCEPDHSNEIAWLPVTSVEDAGSAFVFDVATGDKAESFLAGGIVVHNCGNKAVRTSLRAEDLRPDLSRVMDEIVTNVEFGMGRSNERRVDHPVLDAIRDADFTPQRQLHGLAASQLGTVGSGNHYTDLFEDDDGLVWIGVHFGSRGFGHKTASGFLALAEGKRFTDRGTDGEMEAPPVLFDVNTELGQSYVAAMTLAGDYAYAGRDVVVDEIVRILGTEITDEVHNHHNYIWRETHGGEDWWVVRKGATPAFPGQRGFVGASMGEPAVILEGVETDVSAESLYSTVHGAGRAMSRTKAAGRPRKRWVNNLRDDETLYGSREEALAAPGASKARSVRIREGGAIDFDEVLLDLKRKGIELRGGAADEAPGAYKRLNEVLSYHEGTVRILHTLTPLGVAMAGADTVDPYKD